MGMFECTDKQGNIHSGRFNTYLNISSLPDWTGCSLGKGIYYIDGDKVKETFELVEIEEDPMERDDSEGMRYEFHTLKKDGSRKKRTHQVILVVKMNPVTLKTDGAEMIALDTKFQAKFGIRRPVKTLGNDLDDRFYRTETEETAGSFDSFHSVDENDTSGIDPVDGDIIDI